MEHELGGKTRRNAVEDVLGTYEQCPSSSCLLETIKDPVRLEGEVMMTPQFSSGGTFIRVPKDIVSDSNRREEIYETNIAKHWPRKSSARADSIQSEGTGGPCLVW